MSEPGEITALLDEARNGDQQALARVIPLVYQDLRHLAAHYMHQQRPSHTLQATALVHEVYLRLAGREVPEWHDREHFFASAAQIMRHLLVDYARARNSAKRGSGAVQHLEDTLNFAAVESGELLEVDQALARLAAIDARQSQIVELRYFGGLSVAETAAALDVSERTIKREWKMAKAWLYNQIRSQRILPQ